MADNEIFPLFELPPELRDMIYEYVILVKDPNDFLKAACLNEKFYGEVLDVYYREIPFLIWQGNYWNIQESVSINTMSSIRNAKIDLSGRDLTGFNYVAGFKSFFVGTESKFMQAASLRTLTIQAKQTRHPTSFFKEFIAIAFHSFPNLSTLAISFPLFEDFDDFLDWLEMLDLNVEDYNVKTVVGICVDTFLEGNLPDPGLMAEMRKIFGEESYYVKVMDVNPDWESEEIERDEDDEPELPIFWGRAVWQATRGRTLKEKKATKKLTYLQVMEVCELDSEDWPELEDSDRDWWNTW